MPKIKTPVFRIVRLCAPILNEAIEQFAAAKMLDSDGGKRITLRELQTLGVEVGLKVGSVVAEELVGANRDIIDAD